MATTILLSFIMHNNKFQINKYESIETLHRALNIKVAIHSEDAHFNLLGVISSDTFENRLLEEYCKEGFILTQTFYRLH